MKRIFFTLAVILLSSAYRTALAQEGVYFINLTEGAKVVSPIKVVMGVNGKSVAKAGEIKEGTGHHHLIIDGAFITEGTVVPADDKHIHFGGGQTETEVALTPGVHSLTLQFADGAHRSYGEKWSKTIHIEVTSSLGVEKISQEERPAAQP